MASVVEAFPRRPIKLVRDPKRRNWRIVLLAVALLSALPALYWGSKAWTSSQLRADLRARGVQAAETMDADGECTSRRSRISNSARPIDCWFTVSYRLRPEEGGTERKTQMHLLGGSPIFTPPVFYDPQDPERAMLQPEMEREMTWSELIGPVALLLIPGMILLAFFFTARRGLAAAAAAPQPIVVAIDKAVRSPGRLFLHTIAPGASKAVVDTFSDPTAPLLVPPPLGGSGDRQYALALQSPMGRHYVLDSALALLDLSPGERSAVLEAARGY
ncbi:MAG TPA: hypothetical protein VEW04_08860 [Allosphingosinicella sp.]|nr:hypothetical protein [Allosphingosinicella sp.]